MQAKDGDREINKQSQVMFSRTFTVITDITSYEKPQYYFGFLPFHLKGLLTFRRC